jgi:ubiquinone/menaquinone biosynthesis C-methylase UbiE|nr:class I SAM-dependent methyltransferase [uncultured Lachnoclostridium sp.]
MSIGNFKEKIVDDNRTITNLNYQSIIAQVWDNINECLTDKATSISHEEFLCAKHGELKVTLAGVKLVPEQWFPPLKGMNLLGLASGGGQQCPVFVAHGANVTVMDLSDRQLDNERVVAEREKYEINIVKADMSKKFPFNDNSFNLIFHPVSNCYIEHIQPLWEECARVIKSGGILMMGFIKEEVFMFEPDYQKEDFLITRHSLPFNPLTDLSEEKLKQKYDEKKPIAFSHTLTEQIGGIIKAGFEITDIFEDCDGGGLFDKYMNSYVAIRAVRK